jgi:glycogen operon protein
LSLNQLIRQSHKAWHGVRLNEPDWSDRSHSVAFTVEIPDEGFVFHVILSAYWEALKFELPPAREGAGGGWRRWIDTSRESPNDIVPWEESPPYMGSAYRVEARSVVALYTLSNTTSL